MKKYLLLFFLSVITVTLFAQKDETLNKIPYFVDSKIINKMCDSLRQSNVDTILIFITMQHNLPYTYLIWRNQLAHNVIRIGDSSIWYSKINTLDFSNTNFKQLAVTEKENQLRFKAPLYHVEDCSYLIFRSISVNYLIESGECQNFILDKRKKIKRENFIQTISCNLKACSISWSIFGLYKRDIPL